MKTLTHHVDFCVVGGGLAGMCAAIAAARHGAKVALIHDRPMLGGNASSEIRMWVCGAAAHGANMQETGILEEINLENLHRNPRQNYSVWDSILYEKVRFEPNITLLLNCSCNDLTMAGSRIQSVKAWQLTTETWHQVEAPLFADCSGDSILAPLSGAQFRRGREARAEFDEDIEPEVADERTMGMSCLFQARETSSPQAFIPPKWARRFESDDDLTNRVHDLTEYNNFWWLELGGENDSIHDTEQLRDELLATAFGIWDHIKNRGEHGAENWELDWVGFLPGKRESRRLVGEHTLTQNDVRAEGRFEDLVAYGGWSMDDHHPAGMRHPGKPTIFHPAPCPFGIPYRCLYSKNIENLFFAGRNISTTHAAMSSTRVMGTCAILGQAVGIAAAIATRDDLSPRGIYEQRIAELQQRLMADDCYLPWQVRQLPEITRTAKLSAATGNPEILRNGLERPIGEDDNGFAMPLGQWVEYRFAQPTRLSQARLVFDSDLNRFRLGQRCHYPLDQKSFSVPSLMTKAFRLEAQDQKGNWQTVFRETGNYQRLVRIPLDVETNALRFVPEETWGAEAAHLFAWDLQ
jgi:hypothetical protein